MDYGVYDWRFDYAKMAEIVCNQPDYCRESDLGYGFLYAASVYNDKRGDGAYWNVCKTAFYTDYHSNSYDRNKVYVMFNNNRTVGYDAANRTAKDPGDPGIPWQNKDFYQGFPAKFADAACLTECVDSWSGKCDAKCNSNRRNYTAGWAINPDWMEDVRIKNQTDPLLPQKIKKGEIVSIYSPMYRCKVMNEYPCQAANRELIPVDFEGFVSFNLYQGTSCKGLYLPSEQNTGNICTYEEYYSWGDCGSGDGGDKCAGAKQTIDRPLYICGYDADGDGVVEEGECPRKLTPQQLAMELMEPGYVWTGYLYIDDGSKEPVFLTTGNWSNMQPFYNLGLVPKSIGTYCSGASCNFSSLKISYSNGTSDLYLPAWKNCTFSEKYTQSYPNITEGRAYQKKSAAAPLAPFWWGCSDNNKSRCAETPDGKIVFSVFSDPSDETYNGENSGVKITKYRYRLKGQTEDADWVEVALEKPIQTYLHVNGAKSYIPNNYSVDIVIEPDSENVGEIEAYFEKFYFKDSQFDFVMLRNEDYTNPATSFHKRMYRRLDAVQSALVSVVNSKKYISEKLPWSFGFYPTLAYKGSNYDSFGVLKSDLESYYIDHYNALYAFFADGATPTGEGLLKSFDYFARNQNKLWSCRDNRVVLISDGYPNNDEPVATYSTAKKDCTSDPKSMYLCTTSYNAALSSYQNSMESMGSFLYGGNVYKTAHDGDDPAKPLGKNDLGVSFNRAKNVITDAISFGYDVQRLKKVVTASSLDPVSSRVGKYFSVSNPESLKAAVYDVINSAMNASASVAATPAVALDGETYGNEMYISIFSPRLPGHWWGTINKVCIVNDATSSNCLFKNEKDEKGEYIYNIDSAKEAFSDKNYVEANIAVSDTEGFVTGVNKVLKTSVNGSSRNIWFMNWTNGNIEQLSKASLGNNKLWNFMQGCKYEESCTARINPMGDFWHSAPLYIKSGSTEYVVAGANDGFLHVFNVSKGAELGRETKIIIPSKSIYSKHFYSNYAEGKDKSALYGVDITPSRFVSGAIDWISVGFGRGGYGYTFIKTSGITGNFDALTKQAVSMNTGTVQAGVLSVSHNMGYSYSSPTLIKKDSKDMLIMPYGYDSWFDKNDEKTASYLSQIRAVRDLSGNKYLYLKGSPVHYYMAEFGANIDSSPAGHPSPLITQDQFPVVGKLYGFKWDNDETKFVDKDVSTFASSFETNMLYYADIIGNVFFKKDNGMIDKLLSLNTLSGQKLSTNADGIINKNALKIFGSVKPVIRGKSTDAEQDREVWIFYGSGDPVRPN